MIELDPLDPSDRAEAPRCACHGCTECGPHSCDESATVGRLCVWCAA